MIKGFKEMNKITDLDEDEEFDWDSDEEISDQNSASFSSTSATLAAQGLHSNLHEIHDGSSSSKSELILHFVGMGFSEHIVAKVLEGNEEEDAKRILETLLTYSFLEKSPPGESVPDSSCSSETERANFDEEPSYDPMETSLEEEKKLLLLT